MTWPDALKLLLPAVPIFLLLLLIQSVIRTHIHIHISGYPDEKKYRIHLENMDDVASLETIRLELRIRGQGSFSARCTQPLGFDPWPAAFNSEFNERTAVLTATGLRRGERWLFEIFTDGDEQGVEVNCHVGRRELPTISSDAVNEFSDNPSASSLNRWLGIPLAAMLYLFCTIGLRLWQERTPVFQWLDAGISILVMLAGLIIHWFMLKPHQTIVAFPTSRPAFPHSPHPAQHCAPTSERRNSRLRALWNRSKSRFNLNRGGIGAKIKSRTFRARRKRRRFGSLWKLRGFLRRSPR